MLNLGILFITINVFMFGQSSKDEIYLGVDQFQEYYDLPELPYSLDSLEPWIDAETMNVHFKGHHASYMAKMNAALTEWRKSEPENELAKKSLVDILKDVDSVPEKWRNAIRNNGGGYLNHIFYFATMSPNPKGMEHTMPLGLLTNFRKSFHNFTHFQSWMSKEAMNLFGSGYVWLCREPNGGFLTIYATKDQASPITYGLQPILVIDVWEHAYYLKHKNKRKNYIDNWWKIVDFSKVEALLNWWLNFEKKSHDEL